MRSEAHGISPFPSARTLGMRFHSWHIAADRAAMPIPVAAPALASGGSHSVSKSGGGAPLRLGHELGRSVADAWLTIDAAEFGL
jgi:hypothetical protein